VSRSAGVGRLHDKAVVITGAARGLGRAFATRVAQEGARVMLVDVLPAVHATAEALRESDDDALAVVADVSDRAALDRVVAEAAARWGRVDGLVNNAALATGVGGLRFDEISSADFDRVLGVNVRGTWETCKALYPLLRAGRRGKIVNLASDTALWGAPRLLHYVASKGAIIAMTRSLARELGPDGISVNCVAPGLTKVEATEDVPPERHQLYEQGRAMPRAQVPEDITGAVVFLLSDDADFITGQLLPVNGGFVFN
jgi:NAD(P)-dependent dehydrogenase (short-subunit alcohol dehydrogenase family)